MNVHTEMHSSMDPIWKIKEIAKAIGRSERQTFHLLASGQLPAKKVGGRWVASRQKLAEFFASKEAT